MSDKAISNRKKWFIAAFLLVLLYGGLFMFWFQQTPLGMTPVLDGAENILLAEKIFQGTLPAEPFYRAMLYPAFLSLFRVLGFAHEDLNIIAAMVGLLFHFANAILVAWISLLIWKSYRASFFALLFYGFYPPALHFAVDPFDITMGIFFLLLSCGLLIKSEISQDSLHFSGMAGLSLGIGSLLRANILPMAAVWLFAMRRSDRRFHSLLALIGVALPLLLGGLANYWHSGQFKIMPWQGPFNLYAANYEKANGKYFQQTLLLSDRELGVNPARLESEILYLKATGKNYPIDIDDFNRWWREQTVKAITGQPVLWLKLVVKKIYYLFNNFEQYNNKTFSFHKQLSPVLRYNPLCFGLLFIFAGLVAMNRPKIQNSSYIVQIFILISIGVLAFYVSARFRILVVPLLVIWSSALANLKLDQVSLRRNAGLALFLAFLTFSGFAGAGDISTYNSDRLLLAHASARLGMDQRQIFWADEVLKNDPENLQAIRVKLVGFTNLALAGQLSSQSEWQKVHAEIEFLEKKQFFFPDTLFIHGCYLYSVKNLTDKAEEIWLQGLAESNQKDLYQAALVLTGLRPASEKMLDASQNSPLLWYAMVKAGYLTSESSSRATTNAAAVKFLFKSDS
ncbi:MAG: hypothetical protein AB1403_00195 [Candidatus Riflebacteria bacterium]